MAQIGAIINPMITATGAAMTAAAPAMQAYGGLATFGAGLYSAWTTKQNMEERAAMEEANAARARIDAKMDADQRRLAAIGKMGRTRGSFGASGLSFSSGTPVEVLTAQAGRLAADAWNIEQSGVRTSDIYKMQASSYRRSAKRGFLGRTIAEGGTLLGKTPEMATALGGLA